MASQVQGQPTSRVPNAEAPTWTNGSAARRAGTIGGNQVDNMSQTNSWQTSHAPLNAPGSRPGLELLRQQSFNQVLPQTWNSQQGTDQQMCQNIFSTTTAAMAGSENIPHPALNTALMDGNPFGAESQDLWSHGRCIPPSSHPVLPAIADPPIYPQGLDGYPQALNMESVPNSMAYTYSAGASGLPTPTPTENCTNDIQYLGAAANPQESNPNQFSVATSQVDYQYLPYQQYAQVISNGYLPQHLQIPSSQLGGRMPQYPGDMGELNAVSSYPHGWQQARYEIDFLAPVSFNQYNIPPLYAQGCYTPFQQTPQGSNDVTYLANGHQDNGQHLFHQNGYTAVHPETYQQQAPAAMDNGSFALPNALELQRQIYQPEETTRQEDQKPPKRKSRAKKTPKR